MGLGQAFRSTRRFVSEYTGGVRSSDLDRLFRRDAADAWQVLTRDQPAPSVAPTGLSGWFHRARLFFLGVSYQLSPPRRMLFAAALASAFLGMIDVQLAVDGQRVRVDASPALLLFSVALLVFLLALELVERVRVRDELEVARQLQRDLLPVGEPPLPGYEVAHTYRTANAIGGDYYDFLPLPDGRMAIFAGDASGHGIAAGLLMVVAKTALGLAVELDPEPRAVAALLDKALAGTGGSRSFMTAFYGLLEPASGHLDFVCAGHPFPLVRRTDGTVVEIGEGAPPLGRGRPWPYAAHHADLAPGDLLLLYSDGIPEALHGPSDETFGFPRLRHLLAPGGTPARVQERIIGAFDEFLQGEAQADDISVVVLRRIG